jgi:signal transduction histidine kinase
MADKSSDDLLEEYLKTLPEKFIGKLVHDARGPLSGIISASKLMDMFLGQAEPLDADKVHELNKIILKCTENLRSILDAAVEYDRIQQSRPPGNAN